MIGTFQIFKYAGICKKKKKLPLDSNYYHDNN